VISAGDRRTLRRSTKPSLTTPGDRGYTLAKALHFLQRGELQLDPRPSARGVGGGAADAEVMEAAAVAQGELLPLVQAVNRTNAMRLSSFRR